MALTDITETKHSLVRIQNSPTIPSTTHVILLLACKYYYLVNSVPESGYIYVLINPVLEGLVKVGMTTRTPEERAKEISASTGVPTPFVVAFYESFHDCSAAEQYVHAKLESQGYRHSENREFFAVELNVVIRTILEAKQELDKHGASKEGLECDEKCTASNHASALAEAEKNLLVFKLLIKLSALLKDAISIINEADPEGFSPEDNLKIKEFDNIINESEKTKKSALESAEDDLFNHWETSMPKLLKITDLIRLDDHEPELVEDYQATMVSLVGAVNDAGDTQGVLALTIAITYSTIALEKARYFIHEDDLSAPLRKKYQELYAVDERIRPVTRMLHDALLENTKQMAACLTIVAGLIPQDEDRANNMHISLLDLFDEHNLEEEINPLINEVCLREAESALKELQSIQDNANLIDPQTRPRSNKDVCSDILTLAKESYYGLGDALEDYGEAERLFMQAAKLKCPEAFLYLGDMQYIGLGCRESKAKALDYYRKGVELECNPCRIRMAVVYVSEGHVDNAMKCIKQYMDGITHTNSDVGEIADDIYRFLVVAKVSKIDIGIADFKPSSSIMSALIRRAEKEFEECDDSSMHNFYKSMLIGLGISIEKPGDASVEGIVDKVDWGCTFVNLENGLRGIIKGFEYKRHIGERGKFRVNVNDGSMAQIELVEWL